MKHQARIHSSSRRRFLRGIGGATLALPLLDAFQPRRASAATPAVPCVFVVEMNGVQQAMGYGVDGKQLNEPERFWPSSAGPLTSQGLKASSSSLSEIADHASSLLLVKGGKLMFESSGCGHSGGGNQVLTAARVSTDPRGNKSLAMGESVDYRITRSLTPGTEPFALYAGPKYGYINDHVFFRGPKNVIVGENNPWLAYTKMSGLLGTDVKLREQVATRRKSLNDLVRGELRELLASPSLSTEDKRRLDQHLSSVREIELKLTADLPTDRAQALKALDGNFRTDERRMEVLDFAYELIVLALSSGLTRVAVLQNGDGTDGIGYTIDGKKLPNFHHVSHRINSDGASGAPIDGAADMHHQIDRLRLRALKKLLDRMAATETPEGRLLDLGMVVWTNQISNGNHGYDNMPYVIAGKARGQLKTGKFVSLPSTPNSKILNSLLYAAGVRNADGSRVDDFGDPSLPRGVVEEMIA